MYALAEELTPDSMREVSRRCYGEMLSAGYTSVTEFHYVHHRPDGTPYKDPNALAKAVALAAEETGIRLLLLPVAYARGGLPRFRDQTAQEFLQRVDDLRGWSEGRSPARGCTEAASRSCMSMATGPCRRGGPA